MRRMLANAWSPSREHRARSFVRRGVAGALVAVQAGCYSYVPSPLGQPQRSAPVRVELQQPISVDLGEITVQNVTRAEGEVVQWSDTELVISATQLTSGIGQRFPGQYKTVYLQRENISGIEAKQLSVLRTGLLVGVGAVLLGAAGSLVGGGAGSGDGPGDGAPPIK